MPRKTISKNISKSIPKAWSGARLSINSNWILAMLLPASKESIVWSIHTWANSFKKKIKAWLSMKSTSNLKLMALTESKGSAKKDSKSHPKKEAINLLSDKSKAMKTLNSKWMRNITNSWWSKFVHASVILAYQPLKHKIPISDLLKDSIQLCTKRMLIKTKSTDTDLKYSKNYKLFLIIWFNFHSEKINMKKSK